MKKAVALVLATLSLSSFAQNFDRAIDVKINKLQEAQRSGEIFRLSEGEKQLLNRNLTEAISVLRNDNRPGPGPGPGPRPDYDWRRNQSYNRNSVKVYSDDRCTRLITEVMPRDNCQRLSSIFGHQAAWSVSINNQCVNIPDTSFSRICDDAAHLASSQAPRTPDLEVYSDDRCTNKVTEIDPGVECNALGSVLRNMQVWSVKLFGTCVNIPDTSFSEQKCNDYQNAVLASYENDGSRRRGDDVELFSDDRCTRSVVNVKRGTDCNALDGVFRDQQVWSVRFRGQCVDISDTTFRPACEGYAH